MIELDEQERDETAPEGVVQVVEDYGQEEFVPALPAGHETGAEAPSPYRWFILAGLITAAALQVLDTTIVNVALPQMAGNLGATNEEIGWVVTGYILSNVIFLPMTAFLTARFGRKRYLTTSIIIFVVSSFFCGTSHSLAEIVFWRILQGAGGAALLSTAQATLVQIFPPGEQGVVQSTFMIGLTVAPTLGPTLGGWITDNYTWNWCFLINVPVGILATILVVSFLHDTQGPDRRARVDWPGIGLLAVGLGAMQYVLEEGQQNDWFNDSFILWLAVVSVICVLALIWWQMSRHNRHPVVDFRVLKNPTLSACLLLFVALGFGLYGGTYLFPLLAQTVLGFTSLQTGLALLPGGIATAFAIFICNALLYRPKALVDARVLICFGTGLLLVSMWQLGHLSSQSGEEATTLALLIRGFGMAFLFVPINYAAFTSLAPGEVQQASGLLSLSRQLGGSFGIAAIATFVQNDIQQRRSDLVANVSRSNPIFMQQWHEIAGGMMAHGYSSVEAQQSALAVIERIVMREAMVMSYNDAFLLMLALNLLTLPAVALLRRRNATVAPPVELE